MRAEGRGQQGQEKKTFDFLGFTHYMGKSRNGKRILKRKTSSKKLNASLKRTSEWIKLNRHKLSMPILIADLNQKLRGHYAYYGVTFNSRRLNSYYWEKVAKLAEKWIPLEKPRIYHSYRLAKP